MPSIEDGSFDELLGLPPTPDERQAVETLLDEGVPRETAEQARIRALEAQIAEFSSEVKAKSEVPEKTPAEKEREHRQALIATKSFNAATESYETISDDDSDLIVLHILDSGFTFASKVWWVGQTVKIKRGGKAYEATVDRDGDSWLDDLSPEAQYGRWGKQVVGIGPWIGKPFNDEVSKLDAFRQGAAPVVNFK